MKPVLETKSTYKGYPYVVLFMPGAYRCGYVGIPYSHQSDQKKQITKYLLRRWKNSTTYSMKKTITDSNTPVVLLAKFQR